MSGADIPPLPAEPEFCVTSRRNDSLASRWRWRLFASLVAVSFGFALVFAALGAWMVLPYSALEMVVLYVAFLWIERHASDWERVSVVGDRVKIERQSGGVLVQYEFNRYWMRVEVEEEGLSRTPHLRLRSAGKCITVGEELSAAGRVALARNLRRALAKHWSPA
jgi:uncharacterized membrane protein